MRVLITGAQGQLGWQLKRVFAPNNEILATDIDEMDITDGNKVQQAMCHFQPEIVLHGAAYTQVDKAEEEPDLAYKINENGTRNVVEQAKKLGALMVYISTDFVFDGQKKNPYLESDMTNPLSIYGKSKLAGEEAIKTTGARYIIVRTAWLYGEKGHNFVETILKAADEKPELKVVNDQIGSPTYTKDLAEAIYALVNKESGGIFHIVNAGQGSWYDLARAAVQLTGKTTPVQPIKSKAWPQPAKRPAYSVLGTAKLQAMGITMRDWREALAAYIKLRGKK